MKDLGKILEYQENDIEFRKIDAEFNKNPDKKKLDSAKRDFDGVQREFSASVTEAERLGKEIEQAYAESKAAEARIDELEKAFMAAETDEAKAALLPSMETEKSKLDSCRNKVVNNIDRIKKLLVSCSQKQHEKKKIKETYDNIKATLQKQLETIQPRREALKKRMSELREEVDPELMEVYTRAKKDGMAPPVFVAAIRNGDEWSCICGMRLSPGSVSKLKNDGIYRCDTCRRILYIK